MEKLNKVKEQGGNNMKEILGYALGGMFDNTIYHGIEMVGTNTYKGELYEVWEVSDEVYKVMCDMAEEEFVVLCPDGWWRSSEGSVLGVPDVKYIINGNDMIGWDGAGRQDSREDICGNCEDLGNGCNGSEDDIVECWGERKYSSVIEYLNEEIGASTEKNVCACAMDLAKYNGMTMGELFSKYEPISR